jgi:intracellular septation protein
MKFFYDFLPIVLFFVAYKFYGIYTATVVAIVASVLQVAIYWLKFRRFEKMHLITMVLIVVFGGATLLLKDEMFIKWKPTVLNWIFALVFIGTRYFSKKTIMERMMGAMLTLPLKIWHNLNLAWVIFFIALGFVNLYVVYNFDTDTWVNFKLFGMLGLNFAFLVGQMLYLSRYMESEKTPDNGSDNGDR